MKRIILALSIVAMASTAFAELGPEISKSTNSPFLGMNYKSVKEKLGKPNTALKCVSDG